MARRKTAANRLTRILCALALLSLGLAHQPPQAHAAMAAAMEMADYVLPDGTLPHLCDPAETADADGRHPHQLLRPLCEACLIASATLPPPPPTAGEAPPRREAGRLAPARQDTRSRHDFRLASAPRGPPALSAA